VPDHVCLNYGSVNFADCPPDLGMGIHLGGGKKYVKDSDRKRIRDSGT
jgi:hypothetical protein